MLNTINIFNGNKLRLLIIIYITALAGLRSNVGIDFVHYNQILSSSTIDDNWEPINQIIHLLIQYFELNNYIYFIILSIFTTILFYDFINKFSENKQIGLAVYCLCPLFYLSSLNISRQFFAISIFYWSIKDIESRKLLNYFIKIIIATAVHKSLIFTLPFYFFLTKRINIYCILLILSFLIIFDNMLPFLLDYTKISTNYIEHYENKSMLKYFLFFLVNSLVLTLVLNRNMIKNNIFINLSNFGLILSIYFTYSKNGNYFSDRILFLFYPVIIYSLSVKYHFFKEIYIQYSVLIFLSIYYFYTLFIFGSIYHLTPYLSII